MVRLVAVDGHRLIGGRIRIVGEVTAERLELLRAELSGRDVRMVEAGTFDAGYTLEPVASTSAS